MKHQFKFNPLATAILTLLCGGSIQSGFAATNTSHVSTLDNAQLKAKIQKDQETHQVKVFSAILCRQISTRSSIAWQSLSKLIFCQGTWITPINPESRPKDANSTTSVITADYGHYNPNGDSVLRGDVIIDQEGRNIRADEVTLDSSQTYANAKGRVQLAQSGLLTQSDQINYNLKPKLAT